MEELYHLRVHLTDLITFESIVSFLTINAYPELIVKEIGERPHIHSIIRLKKTKSTFRQQLLKKFDSLKGNGSYSFELVKKKDEMYLYLCKGDDKDTLPDVKFNNNHDIEALHTTYWKNNVEMFKGKKTEKQLVLTWSQKVKSQFEKEHPAIVSHLQQGINDWKQTDYEKEELLKSKKFLFDFCMKCLGRSVKVLDDNIIIRLYKGIYNSYIQESSDSYNYNESLFDKLGLSNL